MAYYFLEKFESKKNYTKYELKTAEQQIGFIR